VAPALMSQMIQAARKGDSARAASIDAQLAGLHQALFLEANPIPVKWALEQMGLMRGGLRLPLTRLSGQYHAAVKAAVLQAGIALGA
jgi:4-hydroxy-tetrahydrodipicolinate synthase